MNVEFSNDSTSNLYTWLELHPDFKRMVKRDSYYDGAKAIREWCKELWQDTAPPAGIVLKEVKWLEIYSVWRDETNSILDEVEKKLDYKLFKEWHEC